MFIVRTKQCQRYFAAVTLISNDQLKFVWNISGVDQDIDLNFSEQGGFWDQVLNVAVICWVELTSLKHSHHTLNEASARDFVTCHELNNDTYLDRDEGVVQPENFQIYSDDYAPDCNLSSDRAKELTRFYKEDRWTRIQKALEMRQEEK